jgi:hypothetical protein
MFLDMLVKLRIRSTTEWEESNIEAGKFTKVKSRREEGPVEELFLKPMATHCSLELGKMDRNTVQIALNNGPTEHKSTQVTLLRVLDQVRANTNMEEASIKAISKEVSTTDTANTTMLRQEEPTRESLQRMSHQEEVSWCGQMAPDTREHSRMEKCMDMELNNMQMEIDMLGNSKMINSMEQVFGTAQLNKPKDRVSGHEVKDRTGKVHPSHTMLVAMVSRTHSTRLNSEPPGPSAEVESGEKTSTKTSKENTERFQEEARQEELVLLKVWSKLQMSTLD